MSLYSEATERLIKPFQFVHDVTYLDLDGTDWFTKGLKVLLKDHGSWLLYNILFGQCFI